MNNERLTLIWHPTQCKRNPNRPPICVNVWIESGVYLIDGTFLLPKLTWTNASAQQMLSSDKKYQQQKKLLQKVDLLDICRIRATETIDRNCHPFPSASRSFYIDAGTDIFLMEAQSPEERDRVVYGLKLVIARLASLLMLRDARAAEEFFGTPVSTPGEAPPWAKGTREATSRGSPPTLQKYGEL
jgi:hypothetical protein